MAPKLTPVGKAASDPGLTAGRSPCISQPSSRLAGDDNTEAPLPFQADAVSKAKKASTSTDAESPSNVEVVHGPSVTPNGATKRMFLLTGLACYDTDRNDSVGKSVAIEEVSDDESSENASAGESEADTEVPK